MWKSGNSPKTSVWRFGYQNNPNGAQDYAFEAALLNMANAMTEGFQSPKGYMDWKKLVAPESWTLTGLNEEGLKECMVEAGKQLSSMLDLMEESQAQVA